MFYEKDFAKTVIQYNKEIKKKQERGIKKKVIHYILGG